MKNIIRRLRSQAGESLIESMAAILIFTMGSIILLSMVSTAADINAKARQTYDSYQDQIWVAEVTATTNSGYKTAGTVTVAVNGVPGDAVTVELFCNTTVTEEDPLYTFYQAQPVVGGGSE